MSTPVPKTRGRPKKAVAPTAVQPTQPSTESQPQAQAQTYVQAQPQGPVTGFSATEYKKMEQREHILKRPDTYVGSVSQTPQYMHAYKAKGVNPAADVEVGENESIELVLTTLPQAVINLFAEIETNAADALDRSTGRSVPTYLDADYTSIIITMTDTTITVTNGGLPIPVQIQPQYGVYVPELILGSLLTSQNYDDTQKRTVAGRNGYGAKLTNIFSNKFTVDIGDPYNGLRYIQSWSDHMTVKTEPQLLPYQGQSYVSISYDLDFAYFGLTKYPPEAYFILAKQAADTAYATKKIIKFNNKMFNFPLVENYAKMYNFKDAEGKFPKHIIHYSWPDHVKTVDKKGIKYLEDPSQQVLPDIEFMIIDTPNQGSVMSFVNGIHTPENGVHVDAAFDTIFQNIVAEINTIVFKKNKGKGKKAATKNTAGKKEKVKEDKTLSAVNMGHVKKHVTLILSCRVFNPGFKDQFKTKLTRPTPKIEMPNNLLNSVKQWNLPDVLYIDLNARQIALLKQNKKKNKRTFDCKVYPANKEGENCTAFYVEGDSALKYPIKLREYMGTWANDYIGIFVGGGVPINTRNTTFIKGTSNKFIENLYRFLGVEIGVDYTILENREALKYKRLVILTDADADGAHIGGLVIANTEYLFRSLLPPGLNNESYLYFMSTRFVVLNNGLKFYTEEDYNEWLATDPKNKDVKGRYYKGLGSNKDNDIEDEAKNPKYVSLYYDESAPVYLNLAFHKKLAEPRKHWITAHVPETGLANATYLPISKYIDKIAIKHSLDNVKRSLPKMLDGLKEVQRKVLYVLTKECKWGDKKDEIKVAELAAALTGKTNYHHGEMSAAKAIITMVNQYVGSCNNVPLLYPDGQFGSRVCNGKDAASPRYIYTHLTPIFKFIYRKEDKVLHLLIEEEGKKCEPEVMLPILPLINGTNGVATGWSTNIPNYHPLEVAMWLQCKLAGYPTNMIMPWYYGFKGMLIVKPRNAEKKKKKVKKEEEVETELSLAETEAEEAAEDDDEEFKHKINIDENTTLTMETIGSFEFKDNAVHVTELPIGMSYNHFNKHLQRLEDDNQLDKINFYGGTVGYYVLEGLKTPSLKKLKLISKIGLSNFIFLTNDNKPVKFKNIYEYLEAFYQLRLSYYHKRKEYYANQIQEKIVVVNYKIKFLELILSKVLEPIGMKRQQIRAFIAQYQIPAETVKNINFDHASEEGIAELRKQVEELNLEYTNLLNTDVKMIWYNELSEFIKKYKTEYPDVKDVKYVQYQDVLNVWMCRVGDGPIQFMDPHKKNNLTLNMAPPTEYLVKPVENTAQPVEVISQ